MQRALLSCVARPRNGHFVNSRAPASPLPPPPRAYSQALFNISRSVQKTPTGIEVVTYEPLPTSSAPKTAVEKAFKGHEVFFVHGEWTGAWLWEEYFMPWFTENGYTCHALSLRGHGGSSGEATFATLKDYREDLLSAMGLVKDPEQAVLVGHGLGALIIEGYHLHEKRSSFATGLLAPYPTPCDPKLAMLPYNKLITNHPLAQLKALFKATESAFMIRNKNIAKKEYFSKNMSEAEIERHFARLKYSSASVIPELVKNAPIFFEGIPLNSKHTFMIVGSEDRLIGAREIDITMRALGLDDSNVLIVPELAHAIPLDPLWPDICDVIHQQIEETIQGETKRNEEKLTKASDDTAAPELKPPTPPPTKTPKAAPTSNPTFVASEMMLPDEIELLACFPGEGVEVRPFPILFVHSELAGAWVWQENFMPFFAQEGFKNYAVSLRGHGNSGDRKRNLTARSENYLADINAAMERVKFDTGQVPIVIAHGQGCIHALRLMSQNAEIPLAVLMNPYLPPKDKVMEALWIQNKIYKQSPKLVWKQLLSFNVSNPISTAEIAKQYLFSDDVPQEIVDKFMKNIVPTSAALASDMLKNQVPLSMLRRRQIFLLGGDADQLVTVSEITILADALGKGKTDVDIVPKASHYSMLDPNWKETADSILDYLDEFELFFAKS